MTYKEYLTLIGLCAEVGKEQALAEYGFPADCELTADSLVKAFDIMDAVAHNNAAELLEVVGMTAYKLGKMYNIPDRSINDWVRGKRTPPAYVLQLLGYALISELPKEDDV